MDPAHSRYAIRYELGRWIFLVCLAVSLAATANDPDDVASWMGWGSHGVFALIVAGLWARRLPLGVMWGMLGVANALNAANAVVASEPGSVGFCGLVFGSCAYWAWEDWGAPDERDLLAEIEGGEA